MKSVEPTSDRTSGFASAAPDPTDDIVASSSRDVMQAVHQLPPSPQLLEFYRDKIDQLHGRYQQLSRKMDRFTTAVDCSWQLREQLVVEDEQLHQLQQTLADLQVFVVRERQRSVHLTAENRSLKLEAAENRQKMHVLQALSGCSEDTVTFYARQIQQGDIVARHMPAKLIKWLDKHKMAAVKQNGRPSLLADSSGVADGDFDGGGDVVCCCSARQHGRCEAVHLRAQLQETVAAGEQQRAVLLDERQLAADEAAEQRDKLRRNCDNLAQQLKKCENMLREALGDYLQLHQQLTRAETSWLAVKDRLLSGELSADSADQLGQPSYQRLRAKSVSLMKELDESRSQCDVYQRQNSRLQQQLNSLRHDNEHNSHIFKERLCRMRDSVTMMRSRYEQLERRRRLESQGFRSDVTLLKRQLKSLSARVSRAMTTCNFPGDQELCEHPCSAQHTDRTQPDSAEIGLMEGVEQARQAIEHMQNQLDCMWQ